MTGCISGVICGIAFTEIKVSKFLNLRKHHVEKIKLIDQKNVQYPSFVSSGKYWGVYLIVRLFSRCPVRYLQCSGQSKNEVISTYKSEILFLNFLLISHRLKVNDVCCFVLLDGKTPEVIADQVVKHKQCRLCVMRYLL